MHNAAPTWRRRSAHASHIQWHVSRAHCRAWMHSLLFYSPSSAMYYPGREAPSLKMGFIVCVFFFVSFFGGGLPVFMMIGWRAATMSSMSSGEERNVGEWVCFASLTWLYGLFVRTFISRTNAYAGCFKMFCILCLCIIFYTTQVKRQKIWLLFWHTSPLRAPASLCSLARAQSSVLPIYMINESQRNTISDQACCTYWFSTLGTLKETVAWKPKKATLELKKGLGPSV